MAINKLNYKFNNRGNHQNGDRYIDKDTLQNMSNKIDEIITLLNKVVNGNNAVYEKGSNDLGTYYKFAGGLLICKMRVTAILTSSQKTGNLYSSDIEINKNFPCPFVETPEIIMSANRKWVSSASENGYNTITRAWDANATTLTRINIATTSEVTRLPLNISLIAIGEWE